MLDLEKGTHLISSRPDPLIRLFGRKRKKIALGMSPTCDLHHSLPREGSRFGGNSAPPECGESPAGRFSRGFERSQGAKSYALISRVSLHDRFRDWDASGQPSLSGSSLAGSFGAPSGKLHISSRWLPSGSKK